MHRREVLKQGAILALAVSSLSISSPLRASPTSVSLKQIEDRISAIERRAADLGIPEIKSLPNIAHSAPLTLDNWYQQSTTRLLLVMQRAVVSDQSEIIGLAAELLIEITDIERSPSEYFIVSRAKAPKFSNVKNSYRKMFNSCEVRGAYKDNLNWYLKFVKLNREMYEGVSDETGVPWHFVAVIHGLECSFNFQAHLHNGDSLAKRTTHVPAGRPTNGNPPFVWRDSAVDALVLMNYAGKKDWSLERTLYRLEGYNGWGYRSEKININTPYLWSFSNHYNYGKYVKDGKFDKSAVSQQCGAAVILKYLTLSGEISW